MNMIDITPIVNAVIALLAAGVSVFLRPWASPWTRRPSTRPSRRQSTSLTAATCRSNNQQGAGHYGPP